MELRGGQAGWSDGQIIAPWRLTWEAEWLSRRRLCSASREISEVLFPLETAALRSDSPLHPSVSGTSEARPTLSFGS